MDYGLTYNADLDRLIGGDFLRDLMGRTARSYLLSLRRAKLLYETLGELSEAYQRLPQWSGASDLPFAKPLAVLELNNIPVNTGEQTINIPVEELFSSPELSTAPLEYRQLSQLIAILPQENTLQDTGNPSPDELPNFVRQLFRTLSCAHRDVGAAFSRNHGCCIHLAALSPRGELLDIYYVTRASEAKQNLQFLQERDLNESFYLLWQLAGANSEILVEPIREAIRTYLGKTNLTSAPTLAVSEMLKTFDRQPANQAETLQSIRNLSAALLTEPR
jgi:hypothetical protein